jgi:FkbM family methyltransferase
MLPTGYTQLLENILNHREKSRAQLYQDIFALHFNGYQKNCFFVEFGATNGVDLSNTYLLEKEFGWRGILAEPLPIWHSALRGNRSCVIDTRCVHSTTGKFVTFANTTSFPELSGIEENLPNDMNYDARKNRKTLMVETVSLLDLLIQNKAPQKIDYLSIDTEGSELEILSNFDFQRFEVNVLTVEHNFVSISREALYRHLTHHGFRRVCTPISRWDDWYVNERNPILSSF